MAKDTAIVTV